MDKADRERLVRVEEGILHIKECLPPMVKRVDDLEKKAERNSNNWRWLFRICAGIIALAGIVAAIWHP